MRSCYSRALLAVLSVSFLQAPARGEGDLLVRTPGGANAMVAADVGLFMKSPLAQSQNWDGHDPSRFVESPSPLPPARGLQNMVLAARLNTTTGESVWEVAVMEFGRPTTLAATTRGVGGFVDMVADKPVVRSRGNIYFAEMTDRIIGVAYLADRPFVARWVREGASGKNANTSAYLREAAGSVTAETPIVMALDLQDVVSEEAILRTLRKSPPAGAATELPAVAKSMAGLKGLTLKIAVGKEVSGNATLHFAGPTQALAAVAKPLVLETMNAHGLSLPDVEQWTFAATGNTVTFSGPLSPPSFRRLMNILQSPTASPSHDGTAAPGGRPGGAAANAQQPQSGEQAAAAASQRYFHAVSRMLDGLRPGPSVAKSAGWLVRDARQIDQLPIMNVDPALVAWGARTSATLRNAASICASGQHAINSAALNVSTPYASYDPSADSAVRDRQAQLARATIEEENRQATETVMVGISQDASQPLEAALDSRAAIRAQMVQKYNVEF